MSRSAESGADLLGTADLLVRARAGDELARERLFASYRVRLLAFMSARLPVGQRGLLETQDLAQEVAFEAFRALDRFEYRGVGSFWAWLRQIALRRLQDVRRRDVRKPAPLELLNDSRAAPAASAQSPLAQLIAEEESGRLELALGKLRPEFREPLLLRLELGLDYATIARDCGCSSAAVARMQVSRAVRLLTRELADEP